MQVQPTTVTLGDIVYRNTTLQVPYMRHKKTGKKRRSFTHMHKHKHTTMAVVDGQNDILFYLISYLCVVYLQQKSSEVSLKTNGLRALFVCFLCNKCESCVSCRVSTLSFPLPPPLPHSLFLHLGCPSCRLAGACCCCCCYWLVMI